MEINVCAEQCTYSAVILLEKVLTEKSPRSAVCLCRWPLMAKITFYCKFAHRKTCSEPLEAARAQLIKDSLCVDQPLLFSQKSQGYTVANQRAVGRKQLVRSFNENREQIFYRGPIYGAERIPTKRNKIPEGQNFEHLKVQREVLNHTQVAGLLSVQDAA